MLARVCSDLKLIFYFLKLYVSRVSHEAFPISGRGKTQVLHTLRMKPWETLHRQHKDALYNFLSRGVEFPSKYSHGWSHNYRGFQSVCCSTAWDTYITCWTAFSQMNLNLCCLPIYKSCSTVIRGHEGVPAYAIINPELIIYDTESTKFSPLDCSQAQKAG